MSKGRLTRQELSWLLTQEAQNAAERLRVGVQVLRTHAPPPPPPDVVISQDGGGEQDPRHHVDASLDALDDVMKMLSNLNQRQSSTQLAAAPRRGRIDLAALIVEVAPEARVSIEPGSGTEVYGDEADFRRMIQVLIGHGTGEGSSVTVRRDGDDVRVSTTLGPDSSPTAGTERAWLSRMALRYGGRHDLEGGNETLVLPAEQSADRNERDALRKELDEARAQGEVYARELAAVFDRGEEVATVSSVPPAPGPPTADRFATITKVCAGVASELRATLGPLTKELGSLRRHDVTDEQLDTLRRRLSHAQELVASLRSIGGLPAQELATDVDLVEVARAAARDGNVFGERNQVTVLVKASEGQRLYVRCGPKAVAALARELAAHAVAASPRGAVVEISVSDDPTGPRLVVDDAGSPLPASGRRAFLALETHAGQYARPSGLPIFMAAELAACVGARLELSDAPAREGADATTGPAGGGLRVAVTFNKT
ncbi:MAG: Sensor protein basS/pmrB [Labilithrix sp.]|nr:Sensor protein basS/pmrB [Labilithrix sp.]